MMKPRYIVAVVALIGALAINLAALFVRAGAQTSENRAALIVQMKDGGIATHCVEFTEPELTGYDLLRRSGMRVIADISNGVSICKIGVSSGCNFPAQKCFCDCQDLNGTCVYWMYYFQDNGEWKYATLGAASQKVTNGSVNGWVYGEGSASSGAMPPLISFEQICNAAPPPQSAAATVTSVPASTFTPAPATPTTATNSTPTGTAGAQATSTVTPLPSPSATVNSAPTSAPSATVAPTAVTSTPPTPTETPVASTGQAPVNVGGYIVFGVIAVGLIVVLLITRRNSGKANS